MFITERMPYLKLKKKSWDGPSSRLEMKGEGFRKPEVGQQKSSLCRTENRSLGRKRDLEDERATPQGPTFLSRKSQEEREIGIENNT